MLYSIFITICVFIGIVFCSGPDYVIVKNGSSRQRQEMGPPSSTCMRPQLNLQMNLCALLVSNHKTKTYQQYFNIQANWPVL